MTAFVVFDLDGLLADTETPEYESWRQVYADFGLELPVHEWLPNVGIRGGVFDPLVRLRTRPGFDETAVVARRRTLDQALLDTYLQPLPGVVRLLGELRGAGIPRALASASRMDWVSFALHRLGLTQAFDAVVSGDQVLRGKPAPDVYLEAARRLGAPPALGVGLEDSMPGITAAKAAGMWCIAVPNPLTRYHDLTAADLVVSSMEEVTVDLLRTLAGRARVTEGEE